MTDYKTKELTDWDLMSEYSRSMIRAYQEENQTLKDKNKKLQDENEELQEFKTFYDLLHGAKLIITFKGEEDGSENDSCC